MTVLVAVDRDPVRDQVLATGLELARAFDESLHVVHLVEEELADGDAKRLRDDLRARVEDRGVETAVSLEYVTHWGARSHARVAEELLDVVADVEVSHLVLGHVSKGLLERLTKGSTAFAVAGNAGVPVTIVSEDVAEPTLEGG